MKSIRLTIASACLGIGLSAASAQEPPPNVNDCTLIQDPVELRNCVLRFEGNRTPPPVTVEAPRAAEPPVSAGVGPAATDIPAAARPARPPGVAGVPASRATQARQPAAPVGAVQPAPVTPAPVRPRPSRDTETSIEQVQVPR